MSDTDYGLASRLLHRIALGWPFITQTSFDIERTAEKVEKSGSFRNERHIFVTGLARAGTTVLLRALHETGVFRSLTYRDMPFVLMPNIWQKLSKAFRKYEPEKERAHGDRIHVSFDSPEAFEEVFWRTFCGDDYIKADHLAPHAVQSETVDLFIDFISCVVASGSPEETRYLSKNNNNLLRMTAIRKAFPNAIILIPFRDPIQQAVSLMKQHQLFSRRHESDRFSYDYMRWLAHHEFGLTHKPFRFTEDVGINSSALELTDINYWLNIWCATYRFLMGAKPEGTLLVNYQSLCDQPAPCLRKIFGYAGIDHDVERLNTQFQAAHVVDIAGVDEGLRSEAFELYHAMREQAD